MSSIFSASTRYARQRIVWDIGGLLEKRPVLFLRTLDRISFETICAA